MPFVLASALALAACGAACGGDGSGPTRAEVAAVEVAPAARTMQLAEEVVLSATPRDAAGAALSGRVVEWSSSSPSVATVAAGVVRALAVGSATITARSEGKSGTAEVTVPAVATVQVGPASPRLFVGSQLQLGATVRDASGLVLAGRAVQWRSAAEGVATVSSSGMVQGVGEGSAAITATSEGRSAELTVQVRPAPPAGRWLHGTVYDEARRQLLVFGGSTGFAGTGTGAQFHDDLWAWDGDRWTRLATGGPSPREPGALVYDAARARVVLHGGRGPDAAGGTVALTDSWEWDGSAWTRRALAGPPARAHATAGYDRARHRVVLHGGETVTNQPLYDTWEWDGAAWTQASSAAPSAYRLPSPAVWDETRQALVTLVGDVASNQTQLWRWGGTAWSIVGPGPALSTPLPMASQGASGVVAYEEKLATSPAVTWRWDGQSWSALSAASPPSRFGTALAYDAGRQRVVLFGGLRGTQFLNDVWEWDGAGWVEK